MKREFNQYLEHIKRVLRANSKQTTCCEPRSKETNDSYETPAHQTHVKIDFHGLQLVPYGVDDTVRAIDPMDIHPKSRWHMPNFVKETGGFFPPNQSVIREISMFDAGDLIRRDMLVLLMRSVIQRQVVGDFAEVGVFRGLSAKLIHYYAPDRPLHLFDTFTGFDERDLQAEQTGTDTDDARKWFRDTTMAEAAQYIAPKNLNVHFHPGFFPDSVPGELKNRQFAFVHLDLDLYAPIKAALEFFYGRSPPGAIIVVHDYNAWLGARKAVDDFFADKLEIPIPMPDRSGSAVIVKG